MKTTVKIQGLFEGEVNPGLMRSLAAAYPEGRVRHYFECSLEATDPRITSIRSVLAEAGYQPWLDDSRPRIRNSEYSLVLAREYDPFDLYNLPFLELAPKKMYCGNYRHDSTGFILLEGAEPRPLPSFAKAAVSRYLVPESVKARLESSGLLGLLYRPTIDDGRSSSVPWWEICSNIQMPPLSHTMDLRTRKSLPALRDGSTVNYVPKEGFYEQPELRYRQRDVSNMSPFDLAYTHEMLGGDPRWQTMDRRLIVSNRFYQFCISQDLQTEWIPVRLDDDAV